MQHSTSFRVGDIVKFKEDYYLLLEFGRSTKGIDCDWDVFMAMYLNTGEVGQWGFNDVAFIKVA